MQYEFVILDTGARAILRDREAIASLKRFGEMMHVPFVRYIGQAQIVQGCDAGAWVHTVRLPAGTVLCYLRGSTDESEV